MYSVALKLRLFPMTLLGSVYKTSPNHGKHGSRYAAELDRNRFLEEAPSQETIHLRKFVACVSAPREIVTAEREYGLEHVAFFCIVDESCH